MTDGPLVSVGDATRHREILFWREARGARALEFVPRLSVAVPRVEQADTGPRADAWLAAWRAASRAVNERGTIVDLRQLRPGVRPEVDSRLYRGWAAGLPEVTCDQRDRVAAAVRDEGLLAPAADVWLGVLPLEREFMHSLAPGAVLVDRGVLEDLGRLRDALRRAVNT